MWSDRGTEELFFLTVQHLEKTFTFLIFREGGRSVRRLGRHAPLLSVSPPPLLRVNVSMRKLILSLLLHSWYSLIILGWTLTVAVRPASMALLAIPSCGAAYSCGWSVHALQ